LELSLLEECFEVIRAWGFKYKTSFKTTSKGFLIPLPEAEKYCIRKIELKNT